MFNRFDDDLIKNSDKPIETLVKVGDSLGRIPSGGDNAASIIRGGDVAHADITGNDKADLWATVTSKCTVL